MSKIFSKLKKALKFIYIHVKKVINKHKVKNRIKIFCIGRNKTGTTTMKVLFEKLGYIVGEQREAELLQNYYLKGDFEPIIKYCKTGQIFQDYPFSYPETYKHLDRTYPNSKFILTIRDSEDHWYNSLVQFHSKEFGSGNVPSSKILKNLSYVYKGWMWNNFKTLYQADDIDPYSKEKLITSYRKHNEDVKDYFKDRPDDFIVINVSKQNDFLRLKKFLNLQTEDDNFPWANRTSDMKVRGNKI